MRAALTCACAVLLAASLVGCEPDPDDVVFITGQVVDTSGAGLAERSVLLRRSPDEACIVPDALTGRRVTFEDFGSTSSGAEGDFFFQQTVAEVSARFKPVPSPAPFCFEVALPPSASAGSSSIRFQHTTQDMELAGPLEWRAAATLSGTSQLTLVPPEFPSLPGVEPPDFDAPGRRPSYDWLLTSNEQLVWLEALTATPLDVTAYVREDYSEVRAFARAFVYATFGLSGRISLPGSRPFVARVDVRSTDVELPAGGLIPVSRGAPCEYARVPAGPCPLTDGKLDPVALTNREVPGSLAMSVVFRLPAAKQLRTVVVRGLSGTTIAAGGSGGIDLVVEGSTDGGATYVPLGTVADLQQGSSSYTGNNGAYRVGSLSATAPAVALVRLRLAMRSGDPTLPGRDLPFERLSEISLFE